MPYFTKKVVAQLKILEWNLSKTMALFVNFLNFRENFPKIRTPLARINRAVQIKSDQIRANKVLHSLLVKKVFNKIILKPYKTFNINMLSCLVNSDLV